MVHDFFSKSIVFCEILKFCLNFKLYKISFNISSNCFNEKRKNKSSPMDFHHSQIFFFKMKKNNCEIFLFVKAIYDHKLRLKAINYH